LISKYDGGMELVVAVCYTHGTLLVDVRFGALLCACCFVGVLLCVWLMPSWPRIMVGQGAGLLNLMPFCPACHHQTTRRAVCVSSNTVANSDCVQHSKLRSSYTKDSTYSVYTGAEVRSLLLPGFRLKSALWHTVALGHWPAQDLGSYDLLAQLGQAD
jgi:hypothetical protein